MGKIPNTLVKKLKKAFLHAQAHYKKWKIKINESKPQTIIFPFSESLSVDGVQIPLLDAKNRVNMGDH